MDTNTTTWRSQREWQELHTRLNGGDEVLLKDQLEYFFNAAPVSVQHSLSLSLSVRRPPVCPSLSSTTRMSPCSPAPLFFDCVSASVCFMCSERAVAVAGLVCMRSESSARVCVRSRSNH